MPEFNEIVEGVVPPKMSPTAMLSPRAALLAWLTVVSSWASVVMAPGNVTCPLASSKYCTICPEYRHLVPLLTQFEFRRLEFE